MGEIKSDDLQEVKKPVVENYLDIKPHEGLTPPEAKANWDNEFKEIGDKQ